jgi:hypothetical protein
MADNIKIIGNVVNTQQVARYSEEDLNLLSPQLLKEDFGQQNDYIEYFVYDAGGNLLNLNYNYKSFKLPTTSYMDPNSGSLPIIEIDPVSDLQNLGYSSGEFKTQYNFFNNKISDPSAGLFLKEVSADRTELRVGSTVLSNEQMESGSMALINEISSSAYIADYLINFGNNTQVVAVNVALNKIESGYEILFKLYQPLPDNIQEKTTLWVVDEKINAYVFDINLDKLIIPAPLPQLKGPNFAIETPGQNNVATSYQTYDALINGVQSISTSSYQQLLSLMTSQSIDINVDYTNFDNFIFFSSAEQRLINFYDKVKQIEDYNTNISIYTPLTASAPNLINDLNLATASINNITSNFDGYEYYLYYESSSYTWPKTNSTLPYINKFYTKTFTQNVSSNIWVFNHNLNETASILNVYSSSGLQINSYTTSSTGNQITINFAGSYTGYVTLGSPQTITWYNNITSSAAYYDDNNQNNLIFSVPAFIKDDGNNEQYLTFLKMVGHYFDNIWIFLQSVTDINLANNNLEKGVSKDLVYYVLESLGIKLYNQYGDSDNIDFLVGNSGSANFDNNFTITGSYLNAIPRKDLLAESYKRIYHNLPLLLKTKGTTYGLQTLVSTFGITGSTLFVKEYGGDLKSNTLDEFNNDKVRIVSNSITGSVLSPFISLQQQPTSSTSFRTDDLHYVDISFSPQDKIDIYTSASITAINPTWSIDDYIGDPRYQYSNSYQPLEAARTTYLSPLSASLVPYTGSAGSGSIGATNYNDFIRLIQFFDNSLFKMLKDFVPARTSLSTGITISSPILERNKFVYANPSSTTEVDIEEGTINGPTINTEYTDLYDNITGSKVAYYDGNLTGSYINVNNYFASGNFNPYLHPTASLTAGDIYNFDHSDYDVLFNNVSESRLSTNRQDIEYVFGTTQSILSPAELQDSYESLKSHQLSRYEGVKLSSAEYNNYTPGDISFGKTAVIDHNSRKLGLFTDINVSTYLPGRSNVRLLYLVDEFGGLTELNLRNKHWQEIQNTFIQGETLDVSQFDNQKFNNQKTTDGTKAIFDSGYAYSPILYFSTCSIDPQIYFQYNGSSNSYLALAKTEGTASQTINGYATNNYPLSSNEVKNIFDVVSLGSIYLKAGTINQYPTYSVQEGGNHKVSGSLSMNISMPNGGSSVWSLGVYKNGSSTPEVISTQTITISNAATSTDSRNTLYGYSIILNPQPVVSNKPVTIGITTYPVGTTFYKWGSDFYTSDVYPTECTFVNAGGEWYSLYNGDYMINTISPPCSPGFNNIYSFDATMHRIDNFSTSAGIQTVDFNINSSTINVEKNDTIDIRFKNVSTTTANFTASFSNAGSLYISSLSLTTGYASTNCPYFNSASMAALSTDPSNDNVVIFANGISGFHGGNYSFIPNPLTGSLNSLYSTYGDVDYPFSIKPYDVLIVYLSDNTYVESRILEVIGGGNQPLKIRLENPLSSLLRSNLTVGNGNYKSFLILSKIPDETSAYLTFKKRDGKTSYGFIIPNDIAPDVLANMDTITKEVKQKLINEQAVINDINGGTFS